MKTIRYEMNRREWWSLHETIGSRELKFIAKYSVVPVIGIIALLIAKAMNNTTEFDLQFGYMFLLCIGLFVANLVIGFISCLLFIIPGTKEPFEVSFLEETKELTYRYKNKEDRFFVRGVSFDKKGGYIILHASGFHRPLLLINNDETREFAALLINNKK